MAVYLRLGNASAPDASNQQQQQQQVTPANNQTTSRLLRAVTMPTVSVSHLLLAMLLLAGAAAAAPAPTPAGQVLKTVCFNIYMTPGQEPDASLDRGIGLVVKYLTQAADLVSEFRTRLHSERLRNKTLPTEPESRRLPGLDRSGRFPGKGTMVDLFHQLAVSCLVVEKIVNQKFNEQWSGQLKRIQGELVESLCQMHVLLHLTSNRLTVANLEQIGQLFSVSMSAQPVPASEPEMRHFRDFLDMGFVHKIARRSIEELSQARQWLIGVVE